MNHCWTYQNNAIKDLQNYELKKTSVEGMQERIKELEARFIKLGGASGEPVQGGASKSEDNLANNIDERNRLTTNIESVERHIARVERGLAALDRDERLVLEKFYINRPSRYLDWLCDNLHCEQATVYRIKDRAIYKFTLAMYGLVDA